MSIIGGALAFKATRVQNRIFYKYTTTINAGQSTGACLIEFRTFYTPTQVGGVFTTFSHLSTIGVSTCTTRIIPNA
jgi:hypothetical protein